MASILRPVSIAAFFVLATAFYTGDAKRHIGLWKGNDNNDVGYINLDTSGFAYFIINNDTLGGKHFLTPEGNVVYMQYQVDESKDPATIDFIMYIAENNMEVGRLPGIFKIDAQHKMTLCVNFEGSERPKVFAGEDCIVLEKVK